MSTPRGKSDTKLKVLPAIRECWVVVCGTGPGVIDSKRKKTWQITTEDELDEAAYTELRQEVSAYARHLKYTMKARWVRVEWTGFSPLGYAENKHDNDVLP